MEHYQKGTPLTTEELHALREYMKEMQALQAEEPERLTLNNGMKRGRRFKRRALFRRSMPTE